MLKRSLICQCNLNRTKVADYLSTKRNLKELFLYNTKLKFEFVFTRLLSDVKKLHFDHASALGFRGIKSESIYTLIENEKKRLKERGEKFDINNIKIFEDKIEFRPNETKKEPTHVKRRKSVDVLKKFDYRKLDFEIKQMKKNA